MSSDGGSVVVAAATQVPSRPKGHHVTAACDACRSKKIKCDGKIPCQHCLNRGETCMVSERKKRGRVSKVEKEQRERMSDPAGSGGDGDLSIELAGRNFKVARSDRTHDMLGSYNRTALLDTYFGRIAPYVGMTMISRLLMQNPENTAQHVQLNLILATSAMYTRKMDLAESLMSRARALAGEIFDEYSIDSLMAFALLTEAYMGRDPKKAAHYANIALSISQELQKSQVIGRGSKHVMMSKVIGYVSGVTKTEHVSLPLRELEDTDDFFDNFAVALGGCYMGILLRLTRLSPNMYEAFDRKWMQMYPGSREYLDIMLNRFDQLDAMVKHTEIPSNISIPAVMPEYAPSETGLNEATFAELNGALVAVRAALARHSVLLSKEMQEYWSFKLTGLSALVAWRHGRLSLAYRNISDVHDMLDVAPDYTNFPACTPSMIGALIGFCYSQKLADVMERLVRLLTGLAEVFPVAAKAAPVFSALLDELKLEMESNSHSGAHVSAELALNSGGEEGSSLTGAHTIDSLSFDQPAHSPVDEILANSPVAEILANDDWMTPDTVDIATVEAMLNDDEAEGSLSRPSLDHGDSMLPMLPLDGEEADIAAPKCCESNVDFIKRAREEGLESFEFHTISGMPMMDDFLSTM